MKRRLIGWHSLFNMGRSPQWYGKDALGRDVAFERVGNDLYVNGSWYGRVVEERGFYSRKVSF